MGTKFGKQYTLLANRGERERLLFVAAAGLALSLLIITLLVVNFKPEADARELQTTNTTQSSQIVGTVSLLAPERVVRAGTKLSDVKFKEVFWPRNQVPDEAIRDISEIHSAYAKADLQPGLPIQRLNLTSEPMLMNLPLTPGMRAVSIDVDATSGLEGHALPGSKVDVVLTFHEDNELTSKAIVENARVLSYGGDTKRERNPIDKVAPQISKTITLEVSPENALKIQTARQMGRLSLLLRAPEDEKSMPNTDVTEREIGNSKPAKGVKSTTADCNRGKMIMGGKEYIIGCDGSPKEIVDTP